MYRVSTVVVAGDRIEVVIEAGLEEAEEVIAPTERVGGQSNSFLGYQMMFSFLRHLQR